MLIEKFNNRVLFEQVLSLARSRKSRIKYRHTNRKVPRGYQIRAQQNILRHLRNNHQYALMESATGTGKTLIMRDSVHSLLNEDIHQRALFVSHNANLNHQFQSEFNLRDPHFPDDFRQPDPTSRLRMATIQQLFCLRKSNPSLYKSVVSKYGVLIVDEVQHYPAFQQQWINIVYDFLEKGAYLIGATANTLRYDRHPLIHENFHENLVFRYDIQDAVNDGYLSEVFGLVCR